MGDGHARRPDGTVMAGPKWEGGRPASGDDRRVDRDRKYFTVVGDVHPYGGACQGGTGGQAGGGNNSKVWHVQHEEWTEQGSVIGTLKRQNSPMEFTHREPAAFG